MRGRPRRVKDFDFDNDIVMIDIRENFKEDDIPERKNKSDLRRKILIVILVLMVALYVLARLRL